MRARHLFTIAAMLVATSACKPDAAAPVDATAGAETIEDSATNSGPASDQDGRSEAATATARGGAFAREPGFQLPVPVSSTPVRQDAMAQGRQADPVAVRTAVMESLEGLEGSTANVQVQVSPRGIVSLSGEVGSVAEMQHVHYVARAQPGVVEVDYRNLVVRQR